MTTTPVLLSGKSRDRGTWQATVHRVTKGQTQLNTHIHNRHAQGEDDVMIHREKTLPWRRRQRLELCCQRPGATRPGREALAELISWVPCLFLVRAVTAFKPRLCQLGVALRWLYNHASLNSHPPCSLVEPPLELLTLSSWVLDGLLVCNPCSLVEPSLLISQFCYILTRPLNSETQTPQITLQWASVLPYPDSEHSVPAI